MPGAACGSSAVAPVSVCPLVTVSKLVPRWAISASSEAWAEAARPSTATIAATPIAMPRADSPARSLRVRSPILARAARSAGRSRAMAGAEAGCGDVAVMTVLPARAAGGAGLMSAVMRPSSISMRRRARVATVWSWVTMMTVVPCRLSSSSRARIAAPVAESRLPVGSSASTTGGAPATARAIATRCRSPPDSWAGRAVARWPSPTRSRACSASRRRWPRRMPAYSSPSATLPSTLWCSARKNCWNTNPIRAARTRGQFAGRPSAPRPGQ